MRQQPSFVSRYLEIIDEMRLAVVEFVAARTGLDPRRNLYPMLRRRRLRGLLGRLAQAVGRVRGAR